VDNGLGSFEQLSFSLAFSRAAADLVFVRFLGVKIARIVFWTLLVVAVVGYYVYLRGLPTVTWTVFGSRRAFQDFMSASDVTAQRLHPASDDW
jgi:hypothetical protein